MLNLPEFDEAEFNKQISRITVEKDNHLTFSFRDGSAADCVWKNQSRADSWTPEMKEKVRQMAIEQHRRKKECQKEE